MALKRSTAPSGTLVVLEPTSRVLRNNPLGDRHVRKLGVWLPRAARLIHEEAWIMRTGHRIKV